MPEGDTIYKGRAIGMRLAIRLSLVHVVLVVMGCVMLHVLDRRFGVSGALHFNCRPIVIIDGAVV